MNIDKIDLQRIGRIYDGPNIFHNNYTYKLICQIRCFYKKLHNGFATQPHYKYALDLITLQA